MHAGSALSKRQTRLYLQHLSLGCLSILFTTRSTTPDLDMLGSIHDAFRPNDVCRLFEAKMATRLFIREIRVRFKNTSRCNR